LITLATPYAGTYNASGDTRMDRLAHTLLELEEREARVHPRVVAGHDGVVLDESHGSRLRRVTGRINADTNRFGQAFRMTLHRINGRWLIHELNTVERQ
jgi:predicted Zn-dependent protease